MCRSLTAVAMSSPPRSQTLERSFWVVNYGTEPGASRVPKRVPLVSEGVHRTGWDADIAAKMAAVAAAFMPRSYTTADAAPGYTGVRRVAPVTPPKDVPPPGGGAAPSPPPARTTPVPSIDKFTMVRPADGGATYRAVAFDASTGVRVALQCFDDPDRDRLRRDIVIDTTPAAAELHAMGRTLLFNEKWWSELYVSLPAKATPEYEHFMEQALRALGVARGNYIKRHDVSGE